MDPILQQLQRYYQQQQQPKPYPTQDNALVNSSVHLAYNPWWLKLRKTLQHESAQKTTKPLK